MKAIQELIKRVEHEINKTPSGELRNLLCDVNIVLQQQLLDTPGIINCIDLDADFTKALNQLVQTQRKKNNSPQDDN